MVNCLYNVPLDEFDKDEIESFIDILDHCKNIEEGETELVISKFFNICSKFVLADYH